MRRIVRPSRKCLLGKRTVWWILWLILVSIGNVFTLTYPRSGGTLSHRECSGEVVHILDQTEYTIFSDPTPSLIARLRAMLIDHVTAAEPEDPDNTLKWKHSTWLLTRIADYEACVAANPTLIDLQCGHISNGVHVCFIGFR